MNFRHTSRLALAATVAISFSAMAAGELTSAEIKDKFSNKTIDAVNHAKGGKSQLTYFSAGGQITQKMPNGKTRSGTWRVSDKNQQCITWSGDKEVCSTLQARSDGGIDRIVGDKAVVTIQKMRDGNLLDK